MSTKTVDYKIIVKFHVNPEILRESDNLCLGRSQPTLHLFPLDVVLMFCSNTD